MKRLSLYLPLYLPLCLLILPALLLPAPPLHAQHTEAHTETHTETDFRDEFLAHFQRSSRKVQALAEVMTQDQYGWSPDGIAMPLAQVFTHIARYNFLYLETSLGIDPPAGIDVPTLESITDKAEIVALLQQSVDHVEASIRPMAAAALQEQTVLYGRDVASWAVLMQLLAHLNEHVGQAVSYARMNGVAPPWSR